MVLWLLTLSKSPLHAGHGLVMEVCVGWLVHHFNSGMITTTAGWATLKLGTDACEREDKSL